MAAFVGIVAAGCASSHPVATSDSGGWMPSAPDFQAEHESAAGGGGDVVESDAAPADRARSDAAATTAAGAATIVPRGFSDTPKSQAPVDNLKGEHRRQQGLLGLPLVSPAHQ
jgi:hypothetical protein